MVNTKINYWEKFKEIHSKEAVMLSEAYLRGELPKEEFIETYWAYHTKKKRVYKNARHLLEFLDKYKDSFLKEI